MTMSDEEVLKALIRDYRASHAATIVETNAKAYAESDSVGKAKFVTQENYDQSPPWLKAQQVKAQQARRRNDVDASIQPWSTMTGNWVTVYESTPENLKAACAGLVTDNSKYVIDGVLDEVISMVKKFKEANV